MSIKGDPIVVGGGGGEGVDYAELLTEQFGDGEHPTPGNYACVELATLEATENKTYTAPDYTAYDEVVVNVPSGGYDTSDANISSGGQMLSGVTAYGANGKLTGTIPNKSSSDMTVSGKTVTVPAGHYSSPQTKDVADGSATTPATTITANPTISVNSSTGVITASVSGSQSVTPTVSAGYVASGTAGTVSVSGSATESLTTQAAATITPTSSAQTAVAAGKFTLGAVGVEAVVCTNLSAGNIKDGVTVKIGTSTDDDSVTSITGTYQGGGSGGTKPSYLISDGDTVSTLYFNTDYAPSAAFFSGLPYDQQDTYFNYTYLALGYLLAIDLSTIPNAGLSGYVLFWGDPNSPAIIYSTTTFDLSSVMAGMVVTTAGWQMSSLTPSSPATMSVSTSNADFVAIMDEFVAKDDVAFGDFGRFWVGTQVQYDALQTYDSNTYYCITSSGV